MSHVVHGDIHETGLADNCPACAEHAEKPFANLDEDALADLVERTLSNRFGFVADAAEGVTSEARVYVAPRSDTEAVAMAKVMNALEQIGRCAEVAPGALEWYLRIRWRLSAAIGGRTPEMQAKIDALRRRLATTETEE